MDMHRMAQSMGINSVLATPILVGQNKFSGAIVISMAEEDAFAFHDMVLIRDVASMLGELPLKTLKCLNIQFDTSFVSLNYRRKYIRQANEKDGRAIE